MRAAGGARAEMGMQRDGGRWALRGFFLSVFVSGFGAGRLLACDVMNLMLRLP